MRIIIAISLAVTGICLGCSTASAVTFCQTANERNCFTGKFGLVDILGDPDHKQLEADFGYIDANGVGWQTNKATKTDGASIPPLLRPFVGSSWEESYIRAAVIHDWYCDRHVRTWKQTHRVFYDAMLSSGLQKPKAKLLFYAVYAFGPRWGYLVPGQPCAAGIDCIQTTGKEVVFVQLPGELQDQSGVGELRAIAAAIDVKEDSADALTLDQLMAIADEAHPKQSLVDQKPTSSVGITK
ncbi:hypothetical protein DSM25558_4518 [Agrobacterium sp. DSM 25558]|uniref:DUF1353 domain-containing protein n=1 Tax=Agrobacterium sp. DSM 25558 TaxID=1907665 RepID=UPI0009725887|nr:DUF1353 domain-containing protein [Agrobacterium sp. DSM 25558]SCX28616.1 hypothetical protein DSM25558_4518 [Agrobacterium sp. DSM 25558]